MEWRKTMGIKDGMKGDGNDNFFTKPEIAK
jgi:hypothetical protein